MIIKRGISDQNIGVQVDNKNNCIYSNLEYGETTFLPLWLDVRSVVANERRMSNVNTCAL